MSKIKHFTFYELIKSNPEIKKISSHLPQTFECVQNLVHIATILDELRSRFGAPIYVNSGFRSQQYNKCVGGVPSSYHTLGRAVDIRSINLENLRRVVLDHCGFTSLDARPLKKYVLYENENFEVCVYPSFIHLAFKYGLSE